ncbi:hypothetical protein A33M_3148 [Rhodovulum sp. PH10]|nr:hypothetical protein A33M_3148 [Rhodovulum sp. PH10]
MGGGVSGRECECTRHDTADGGRRPQNPSGQGCEERVT